MKDRDNNLVFGKTIPVDLGDLLGLYVEETESVQEYDCIPLVGEKGSGTAGIFRDMVVPQAPRSCGAMTTPSTAPTRPSPAMPMARVRPTTWHHPQPGHPGPGALPGHGGSGSGASGPA